MSEAQTLYEMTIVSCTKRQCDDSFTAGITDAVLLTGTVSSTSSAAAAASLGWTLELADCC